PFSQLQNIFVRVFSWMWISSPMTGSHSGMGEELPRLQQRHLDVAAHVEDGEVLLERAVHPDQAELPLAGLEGKADVAQLDGARPVEEAGPFAEDTLPPKHALGPRG